LIRALDSTYEKLRLSFHTAAVYSQTTFKCQTKNCSLFAHFAQCHFERFVRETTKAHSLANLLLPQDFGDVVNSFFHLTAIGTEWHVEHFGGLLLRRRGMDVGVSERATLFRHSGGCL
jgi:hypothetical protein